jgi:ATP-dependent RNA helicase RhlE
MKALDDLKAGRVGILAATDIAARGIDIDALEHVVNFELPTVASDYVHRIGRTGRAGVGGSAISLVCVDEAPLLRDIQRLLRRALPSEIVAGFTPDRSIPAEPILAGRSGGGRGPRQGSRGGPQPRRSSEPRLGLEPRLIAEPRRGQDARRGTESHVGQEAYPQTARPALGQRPVALPGERLRNATHATHPGPAGRPSRPSPRRGGASGARPQAGASIGQHSAPQRSGQHGAPQRSGHRAG